jgi:hypothetical protein
MIINKIISYSTEKKREKEYQHLMHQYYEAARHRHANGQIAAQTFGPISVDSAGYVNPAVLYETATPSFSSPDTDPDSMPKSTPIPDQDTESIVVTDLDKAVLDSRDSVFLVTGDSKPGFVPMPSSDGQVTVTYQTYRHEPLPAAREVEYSIPTTNSKL